MQAILAFTAAFHVILGLLALLAPDTFFDQIGRYGVENSHYVGDVGAFYLAAGLAFAISIVRPGWRAPLLWLGALWYGFHAINHLFDTGEAKSDARGWSAASSQRLQRIRCPSIPRPCRCPSRPVRPWSACAPISRA